MLVAPEDRPDVLAVIPTLGDSERLRRALDGVCATRTGRRLAVLVVVNSAERLEVPDPIRAVTAGLNLGWSGGLAFGAGFAPEAELWLVQDDLVVDPDCLDELDRARRLHRWAAATPVASDPAGLVGAGSLGARRGGEEYVDAHPRRPTPIADLLPPDGLDFVASRGLLVERSAWDAVGGMDPRFYPVQFADVDLCLALAARGFGFGIATRARAVHARSSSTPTGYGRFLFLRNRELLRRKLAGELPDAEVDPRIAPELLATVAVAASDTLRALAATLADPGGEIAVAASRADASAEDRSAMG